LDAQTYQRLDMTVPAKKQKELVKILGKRLKEIPELGVSHALPAEIERQLQLLRRVERADGSCLPAVLPWETN